MRQFVSIACACLLLTASVWSCVGDDPAVTDGEADASAGPCEDPTYCDDKCGASLKDTCGVVRDCSTPCGDARKCDGLRCVCASSPTWCKGRCETVKDNCGRDVVCSGCDGGVACVGGSCGCTPDPVPTTCTGKQCGIATNNCGQEIDCGACSRGRSCNGNICCEPQSQTCVGKCGSVVNNCGQTITCPTACCPDGKPPGAPSNCGGCGKNCTGFTCTSGTCKCPETNGNTDPGDCGHCNTTLNCTSRGYTTCDNGACK